MRTNRQQFFGWTRSLLLSAALMGLSACGGGGGGSAGAGDPNALDGGSAGVNFSLQLQGTRTASGGKAIAVKNESGDSHHAETSDDAGTAIALSEVRVNIREVSFHLPEGMTCEEVQFTFVDPVRCDKDLEDSETGNDDGTPDQGTGDLLKAEGVDDGTPDQGSGDAPAVNGGTESEDAGDAEDKVVVDGPFIADLINGTTTPSLSNLLIPSGNYRRIEVKIDEAKAEDGTLATGDSLLGNSLVATGSFEYQGATHSLKLALKFSESVRFENDGGIPVAETGANDVVVTLDENTWFRGINLTACLDSGDLALEGDGSLVIDENTGEGDCGDIENTIKDNIENSGSTFKDDEDDDDDGIADSQDTDDNNDGISDDQTDDNGGHAESGDDQSGTV
ncbi:MAG: hypothetical protein K8R69_11030 [Deltaproteobacteria bacterium]|nr:hypothetical protein [Deltaproteobacteria bacterium]